MTGIEKIRKINSTVPLKSVRLERRLVPAPNGATSEHTTVRYTITSNYFHSIIDNLTTIYRIHNVICM
jgi:hypothetical protein